MSYDFTTTTYGKWILTGEHAVIRGHCAIVFPIKSKNLILSYSKQTHKLNADYSGSSGEDLHLLFWSVLEHGMSLIDKSINILNGHFHLNCNIPIGAGMGASAALCVATARWFAWQKLIKDDAVFDFAKELENLFHGQSSGLDIAGVSANDAILFHKGASSKIDLAWQPQWYLSACDQIGITSHCVQAVKDLWHKNKDRAEIIDQQMAESTKLALKSLMSNENASLEMLALAINKAKDCFVQWGLISDSLQHHMQIHITCSTISSRYPLITRPTSTNAS